MCIFIFLRKLISILFFFAWSGIYNYTCAGSGYSLTAAASTEASNYQVSQFSQGVAHQDSAPELTVVGASIISAMQKLQQVDNGSIGFSGNVLSSGISNTVASVMAGQPRLNVQLVYNYPFHSFW